MTRILEARSRARLIAGLERLLIEGWRQVGAVELVDGAYRVPMLWRLC